MRIRTGRGNRRRLVFRNLPVTQSVMIGRLVLALFGTLTVIGPAVGQLWEQVARSAGGDQSKADRPYHGLAVQVHGRPDAVDHYGRLIREVAGLGADTVLLSADAYQEDIDSVVIRADRDRCPTDEQWLELFSRAHACGLRVLLMPKVLLSDPREGAWRGKLAPVSWQAWFEQYTRMVLRFARLAARGRVEVFVIGSELVTTEKHTEQWRDIIRQVRKVYRGKLAYSANWDHFKGIRFWNDLDLIGMTTYYNLNPSKTANPTVESLREAWAQIQADILAWQAEIKRPLLFTEVGWCSQEGSSTVPWNYYHFEQATPAGHQEQGNNYQAFIDTWLGHPEVGGVIWWEWTSAPGGQDDYHYTPRNKPAEQVLRKALKHSQGPKQP